MTQEEDNLWRVKDHHHDSITEEDLQNLTGALKLPKVDGHAPPADAKGVIIKGYYLPIMEEVYDRYGDALKYKGHMSCQQRMSVWHYPTSINLQSFKPHNEDQWSKYTHTMSNVSKAAKAEQVRRERKEREVLLTEMMGNFTNKKRKKLNAYDVLQFAMEEALVAGDKDMAVDIANKIVEYEKPKLARIEKQELPSDFGKASQEDVIKYANGELTLEQFEKLMEGGPDDNTTTH